MLVTIHDENNHIDDVDESDHMMPTLMTCFILSSIESMTMKAPVRPTPALKRKNVLKNHDYHNHDLKILTVTKSSSPSAIIYYSSPAVGHYRTRVRGVQHVNPKKNHWLQFCDVIIITINVIVIVTIVVVIIAAIAIIIVIIVIVINLIRTKPTS